MAARRVARRDGHPRSQWRVRAGFAPASLRPPTVERPDPTRPRALSAGRAFSGCQPRGCCSGRRGPRAGARRAGCRRRSAAVRASRSSERPQVSAALTTPSFRYQMVKLPPAIEPRTISSSHSYAGPDVLEFAPVGEHGVEVRDLVVRRVAPEHVQRGRLALVEGHVPVLDPHRPRRRARRTRTRRCRPRRTRPASDADQARGAAHAAALADLEARPLGQLHVGHDAGADHDGIGRQLQAALRDDLRDAARRPRSARARPRRGPSRRALRAAPGRSVRRGAPKLRSSVDFSCITIVQRLPSAVSDAATSQPM